MKIVVNIMTSFICTRELNRFEETYSGLLEYQKQKSGYVEVFFNKAVFNQFSIGSEK